MFNLNANSQWIPGFLDIIHVKDTLVAGDH